MYKPMYNVKFCKCGMASVGHLLYCAIKNLEEELENFTPEGRYNAYWEKRKMETQLNKYYRAYNALDDAYGRRSHAIREIGSNAYDEILQGVM